MSENSRKGKPIVKRRTKVKVDEVKSFGYSIDQVFEYFISLKKTEGVREVKKRLFQANVIFP
ncbi:hypothetical protein [Bacillus sp. FJAT-47783]|uniref:hypothetical protein n=1 Tax=Bacillus sp. FJAT-47783 TaxID=2922712 RepID=UPI001FAD2650|nr:hypothetical protein [Bacillus sp. FJAT-47783]